MLKCLHLQVALHYEPVLIFKRSSTYWKNWMYVIGVNISSGIPVTQPRSYQCAKGLLKYHILKYHTDYSK